MAEELQVIVQQDPGTVVWNFEQLKAALAERMEVYAHVVYTDDNVGEAKADVAMLRKLRTVVEDRRKEIKNKCLEPYAIIEAQAKELTGLIDKPIALIDKQVKEYEAQRRQKVKDEILSFMNEKFSVLPEGIGKKLQFKIYDDRWENATAKKRDWQEAIEAALKATKGDMAVLEGVEEEFRDKAFTVYSTNLILSEAMQKVSELRKQKEEILERERRRREEEERKRLEAAQRQAYEAENNAAQAAKTAPQGVPAKEPNKSSEEPTNRVHEPVNEPQAVNMQRSVEETDTHTIIFRVTGSKDQLNRIYAFIKASGAAFKWKEEQNV